MGESEADRHQNSVAYTLEDIIGSARQWQGLVDILIVRSRLGPIFRLKHHAVI